jgi:trk system potassium uptake protein TrkA
MERVIIVGAGKVGFHLAKVLLESEYEVSIVERETARATAVVEVLPVQVYRGEGTDIETLKDAGTAGALYFVAATGNDADNLVACQIAKKHFHVSHAIARVIDPANETLFRALDIDAIISTTALAAQTIRNVLPSNGLRLTAIFGQGDTELAEISLGNDSPVIGSPVANLRLPEDCLLIAILRDGTVSLPRGRTILNEGDRVFALVKRSEADELRKSLLGSHS